MKKYNEYLDSLTYKTTSIDEDGNPQEIECTRYVAHIERLRRGSKLEKGV